MSNSGLAIYTNVIQPKPYVKATDTKTGNAGNGDRPNNPTIPPQYPGSFPRVNLNPQFRIGEYNNAEESYHYPRFTEYWKQQKNSNNPIGEYVTNGTGGYNYALGPGNPGLATVGNAENGSNTPYPLGAGKRPPPFAPYNPAVLGVQGGSSQSYPYNPNQTNLEGGVQRVWNYAFNVNEGEPVEIDATGMASDAEVDAYIRRLVAEMDGNAIAPDPLGDIKGESGVGRDGENIKSERNAGFKQELPE